MAGLFAGPQEQQASKQARFAQFGLQQGLFGQAKESLGGIPQQFITGWPTFDEQLSGPSNLEAMSLAGLENLASGRASGAAGGQQFQQGRDVIADILAGGPSDVTDYFERTVQDPALRAYNETILPRMRGQAVGGGNLFGSQQRGAEGQAMRDITEGLARERTRVSFEERQRTTENKLGAIGALGAMSNAEAQYMNQLLQAGATPREIQWAQTSFRLDEFLRQMEEVNRRQSLAAGLAGIQISPMMKEGNVKQLMGSVMSTYLHNLAQSSGQQTGQWSGPGAIGGIAGGACWVAAVYFGWGTPQWHAARNWLMRDWRGPLAPLFRRLYLRYGQSIAKSKIATTLLRPLFIWAARKGA